MFNTLRNVEEPKKKSTKKITDFFFGILCLISDLFTAITEYTIRRL